MGLPVHAAGAGLALLLAAAPGPALARPGAPAATPAAIAETAARPPAAFAPRFAWPQRTVPELLGQRAVDWVVSRLHRDPAVLIIEFPTLREQGAALNRAAALLEKDGAPRDRVLDDAALAALITRHGDSPASFYQGHGYLADQLAQFFNQASRQGVTLNAQEQRLRRLLLDARVLDERPQGLAAAGLQSVISYTAAQPDDPGTTPDETIDAVRRESVLRHELSHALFFTNRAYREHAFRFWRQRLTEDERQRLRGMLARLNYDPANETLMVNEAQAFLMHTPDVRAFNASVLGLNEAQLEDMRRRFREGAPALR
ncbi:MAG: hypothetical protein ACOVQT_02700 [Rubrivivax sp.]